MQVMRELKSGHKEEFYQRRLVELCREAGLQTEMEQRVEVWINDSMAGYLYLDLWIEDSLVVECKALNHDLTNHELHQVLVYLAATGGPVAMLYNFGQSTLEFKRVLRPSNMQDWQKYLYRVIWTPPGRVLPPEDSLSPNTPVRFSITSNLASQPSTLPSSVPVRDSVKESAYGNSGVDIDAGNRAVELMKGAVRATYNDSVLAGIGSFGGLFDASCLKGMESPVLVASTDGVGTKVKLAASVGRYRGVGHDIVNHCINDILVQGARPLFFMDYFATSKLNPEQTAEVVTGIAEACKDAGMVLLGGETAEMPGVYCQGEFDVAGTIVGVVERDATLPRPTLEPGDLLIGLRSSGPHTNGYSLIRKVFENTPLDEALADALLASHRSYLNVLYPHLSKVKALAHITGGGFIENIPRVLPAHLGALIHLDAFDSPPLWSLIQQKGNISTEEMCRVFNMGIGMVAVVDKSIAPDFQSSLSEPTSIIGELIEGKQKVVLD
jgi:phosphoribosylformylglycinamidine cyclo-ligase